MANKLEDIGFYTLEDLRAKNTSEKSPLWRCELLLTSRCNFNCPYCRGLLSEDQGDTSKHEAFRIVDLWASHGLKNIRFSGGEPTLWKDLVGLVRHTKKQGVERIAVSTNGSADYALYKELVWAGVNDFSISLDSCCASTGEKMSGRKSVWNKVVGNIEALSFLVYTTVGVVLTDKNIGELTDIVNLASELGVHDIRIIPSAQNGTRFSKPISGNFRAHPILNYRIKNMNNGRSVRGMSKGDSKRCPLVLDDMAVLNKKHYPCIIYLREHGNPIGHINGNMGVVRQERKSWFLRHNCHTDQICKNNCLDVCVDYNNRVREIGKEVSHDR